jgi:hypothetical protein
MVEDFPETENERKRKNQMEQTSRGIKDDSKTIRGWTTM